MLTSTLKTALLGVTALTALVVFSDSANAGRRRHCRHHRNNQCATAYYGGQSAYGWQQNAPCSPCGVQDACGVQGACGAQMSSPCGGASACGACGSTTWSNPDMNQQGDYNQNSNAMPHSAARPTYENGQLRPDNNNYQNRNDNYQQAPLPRNTRENIQNTQDNVRDQNSPKAPRPGTIERNANDAARTIEREANDAADAVEQVDPLND